LLLSPLYRRSWVTQTSPMTTSVGAGHAEPKRAPGSTRGRPEESLRAGGGASERSASGMTSAQRARYPRLACFYLGFHSEIMMKRTTAICTAISLGCAPIAGAKSATLSGFYRSECAPYDGPAFRVSLPAPAFGGSFWMRADVPLDQAVGRWKHVLQTQPGDGTIIFCGKRGGVDCRAAESGSFQVDSIVAGHMKGSLEARFAGGVVHRLTFNARAKPLVERERGFCG
jgi:hypothetical protein